MLTPMAERRYETLDVVGSGGMATVWRARDRELGRVVALKRPHPSPDGSDIDARFRREAQSAAAVTHPHLVTVYDVGTDDAGPFLVMELLDAPSLAETTVPAEDVGRIGTQVASALAALHAAGIVHRDVKPANILLGEGGAKLTDFGIARSLHETQALTQEGMVFATPAYAAPEVLAGADYTERSDVYALAAVLREMVTGRRVVPHDGTQVLVTDPTWRPLLEAALSSDPADRPTADRFATILRGAADVDTVLVETAAPASSVPGSSNPTSSDGAAASTRTDRSDVAGQATAVTAVTADPAGLSTTSLPATGTAPASLEGRSEGSSASETPGSRADERTSSSPTPVDPIVVARPRDPADRRRLVVVALGVAAALVVGLVAVGLSRDSGDSESLVPPGDADVTADADADVSQGATDGAATDGAATDGASTDATAGAPPTVPADVVNALAEIDGARTAFVDFVVSRRDVTIDAKDADRITEDVAGAMTAVAESDGREVGKRFESAFKRLSKFDDDADESRARELLTTLVARLGLSPFDV